MLFLGLGDYEGWDPRDPEAFSDILERPPEAPSRGTARMVVRGGSAGETPSLMQVSVRRTQEISTSDDRLGFRLIVVPMAE